MHWLYPANTKFYDVLSALRMPTAYWPMNSNVVPGDTVYVYLAAPHKQIGFVCRVESIDLDQEEIMEHVLPFLKGAPEKPKKPKLFMKLSSLSEIALEEGSPLGLAALKEHGLNGMLMGPRKLENNAGLLAYIKENTA